MGDKEDGAFALESMIRSPGQVDLECQMDKIDEVLPRSWTHGMTVFLLILAIFSADDAASSLRQYS